MNAKIEGGYDHHRQILSEMVPLEAPFSLFISPTQRCNFKCAYCTHSMSSQDKQAIGFEAKDLPPDLLSLIVEQAHTFHGEIKRIVFTGLGEPLMNPELPSIIQSLASSHTAGGYEIITNAYLLTPEKTDQLLSAGLTYLRVSIQGMTSQKYKQVTGVSIDYSRLIHNLEYFYQRKGDCKVYIKIIDSGLEHPCDEEQFYKTFGALCDKIYIEHLVKAQPGMIDRYSEDVTSHLTFFREKAEYRMVCPYIFYVLQIDCNGNVFPCPPLGFQKDFAVGNIYKESLWDIWHGKKLYDLRIQHLNRMRSENPICGSCENYLCFTPPEDNLDPKRLEVMKRVEARGHV